MANGLDEAALILTLKIQGFVRFNENSSSHFLTIAEDSDFVIENDVENSWPRHYCNSLAPFYFKKNIRTNVFCFLERNYITFET